MKLISNCSVALLALCCMTSLITPMAAAEKFSSRQLAGTWKGSLPDGPSVELQIQEQNGVLGGRLIMPMQTPGGTSANDELEMTDLQFDGRILSFNAKSERRTQAFRLEMKSESTADFQVGTESNEAIHLTKSVS